MKKINRLINRLAVKIFTIVVIVSIGCSGGRQQGFETSDRVSLLWEITGNGLLKPSYLFGTIHVYDSTLFTIPQEVYTAIDLCDKFALEVDMNDIDQGKLLQHVMIDNPDSSLNQLLEPEVYDEIQKVPFIRMMGEAINMMKPIYIQQYILIENPMTLQSVELDLNNYARTKYKTIVGIETVDEQLAMIDAIPISEQIQGIRDIYDYCRRENIGFVEAGRTIFTKIQMTYKTQDFDRLVELADEFNMTTNIPSSDSALIGSRNIVMAERIDGLVKQDSTLFVALGAMHLPDYNNMRGVIALLKEKGYILRPILISL
jgi:uncharacterized protein YbaP (TraB family)